MESGISCVERLFLTDDCITVWWHPLCIHGGIATVCMYVCWDCTFTSPPTRQHTYSTFMKWEMRASRVLMDWTWQLSLSPSNLQQLYKTFIYSFIHLFISTRNILKELIARLRKIKLEKCKRHRQHFLLPWWQKKSKVVE